MSTATETMIRFFVPGVPAPGGSKRAFVVNGRARLVDAGKNNKAWRSTVAQSACDACSEPLKGPLRMTLIFNVTRPKGHYGKRGLRSSSPSHPTTRPDLTKLVRAVEDAMLGIAYADDSQIVQQCVEKRYAEQAGCYVSITPVGELQEVQGG